MSGPITQISPDTERGDRQDKILKTITNTGQEKKSRSAKSYRVENPRPENSENVKSIGQPPNVQGNGKKHKFECSREAKIGYTRLRLEINLRYAGPPVQTR